MSQLISRRPSIARPITLDPATLPRIKLAGRMLDVPGSGKVPGLSGVFLVGRRWTDHCEGTHCLASILNDENAPCLTWGIHPWMSPNVALRPCIDGVEMLLAVSTDGGTPRFYVAAAGRNAVYEVLSLEGNDRSDDDDPYDYWFALTAEPLDARRNAQESPDIYLCTAHRYGSPYGRPSWFGWGREMLDLPSDWILPG